MRIKRICSVLESVSEEHFQDIGTGVPQVRDIRISFFSRVGLSVDEGCEAQNLLMIASLNMSYPAEDFI